MTSVSPLIETIIISLPLIDGSIERIIQLNKIDKLKLPNILLDFFPFDTNFDQHEEARKSIFPFHYT